MVCGCGDMKWESGCVEDRGGIGQVVSSEKAERDRVLGNYYFLKK